MLYETLTGDAPFVRSSDAAKLFAHINDVPPADATAHALPDTLNAVFATGMAKDHGDRPASASRLIAEAAAALGVSLPDSGQPAGAEARRAASGASARQSSHETPRRGSTPVTAEVAGNTRRPLVIVAVAAISVAAIVAFLIGQSGAGASASPTTLPGSASATDLALRAPGGWTATDPQRLPAIPGLALRGGPAITADQPAAGVESGLAAGAGGPTLLPADLRKRLAGGLPKPARLKLGDLQALRYENVRLLGFDRDLTLFASRDG